MTLKERAALALDRTNVTNCRGAMTPQFRAAVAGWLDGETKLNTSTVRTLVSYLNRVAALTPGKRHWCKGKRGWGALLK